MRRAQVVLRLDQVGLALLIVLERHRLALEQILGALVLDLREVKRGLRLVQARHRGDVIVLRLHGVGCLDHEQRLALDDAVAGPHQQSGHPAGIGREHRRGAVLVDRDLAFCHIFGAEGALGDRLDGQAGPFGRGRHIALQPLPGLARDFRMSRLGRGHMHEAVAGRGSQHQQGCCNRQLSPAKGLHSLGKLSQHAARFKSAENFAGIAPSVR